MKERSRHLIYWLRAYCYTGDMTLMRALKENLGDPAGEYLVNRRPIKEAFSIRGDIRQKERGLRNKSGRKSDEVIVVKRGWKQSGAKGFSHLNEQSIKQLEKRMI